MYIIVEEIDSDNFIYLSNKPAGKNCFDNSIEFEKNIGFINFNDLIKNKIAIMQLHNVPDVSINNFIVSNAYTRKHLGISSDSDKDLVFPYSTRLKLSFDKKRKLYRTQSYLIDIEKLFKSMVSNRIKNVHSI